MIGSMGAGEHTATPGVLSWGGSQLPAYSPTATGALASGAIAAIGIGDPRRALASMLRREMMAEEVILCSSGTDALTRAILAAHTGGDRRGSVALPGYGCYDLATAAVGANVGISLYDLDPATLAPDLDSLRTALRGGARTAVIASLYGLPYDWDAIAALCDEFGAVAIEDVAQGMGGLWKNAPLGTMAPLATLSFGRGKGWSGGRGGALLIRHPRTTATAPAARSAGWDQEAGAVVMSLAQHLLGRPRVFGLLRRLPGTGIGETVYRSPRPAAEMARSAAAIALSVRQASVAEITARGRNAARLLLSLGATDAEFGRIEPSSGGRGGWLRLPVLRRGGFASLPDRALAVRLGISGGYPGVLSELEPVRSRLRESPRLSGAELIVRSLITLPTHSRLRERELQALVVLLSNRSERVAVQSALRADAVSLSAALEN